jgi:phosphate transport system permease protein
MSNATESELRAGYTTLGRQVALPVLALAFVTFLATWATTFQWIDESRTVLGLTVLTLFGVALLLMAAGVAGIGVLSRFGYIDTTPSPTAGLPVGIVFGTLWAGIGAAVAMQYIGDALVYWGPVALVLGVVGLLTATLPREDIGSTLPSAVLLAVLGGLVVAGVFDANWVYEAEWTGAIFPGSELIPLLVSGATLLGAWSAGKAKEGFGAQGREAGAFYIIATIVFSMLSVLGLLIYFIVKNGLETFLTGASLTGGHLNVPFTGLSFPFVEVPFVTNVSGSLFVETPGVMPAVVGTLWLVFGAVLFAVPLGVGAAVFLTEYAEQGRFTQVVEVATNGLWSTPSIVFGLFGLAFLVPRISGGNSIFVGQLVLGFMLLPLVLITSRESIKAVPDEYRDASAALGVSKWKTIRSVVIPAAMPGTITGVILGVGRIAGETAPLLLVFGGAPYPSRSPNVVGQFEFSTQPPFITNPALLEPASALPYQLYSTITAGVFPRPEIFSNQEFGWGTAFVLLLVVLGLYAIGVASRLYFRRKLHYE